MSLMTETQRELARHALGLPNKKNFTNRNYFCIGKGCDSYEEWEALAAKGLAVKRTVEHFGGDDLFHLTLEGARSVLLPKEHISREEAETMHRISENGICWVAEPKEIARRMSDFMGLEGFQPYSRLGKNGHATPEAPHA